VNEVFVVVSAVVATIGVLALWVWTLGRIESRAVRREAEQGLEGPRREEPSEVGGAPRHMRRRDRSDWHPG
jgi:hypothetical protein